MLRPGPTPPGRVSEPPPNRGGFSLRLDCLAPARWDGRMFRDIGPFDQILILVAAALVLLRLTYG